MPEYIYRDILFDPPNEPDPGEFCTTCDGEHLLGTPCLYYCEDCDQEHPAPINACWCQECDEHQSNCTCDADERDTPTVRIPGINVPNILDFRERPRELAAYYVFEPGLADSPLDRIPPIPSGNTFRTVHQIMAELATCLQSAGVLRSCRRCRRLGRRTTTTCSQCATRFTRCSECGEWKEAGNNHCDPCYRTYVHNYNYNASPKFRHSEKDKPVPITQRLYTGVEFEVETGDPVAVAKEIDHRFTFVYLKHDGSLENGFEIVTHPFTNRWLQENLDQFEDLFTRLYSQDAYIRNTCGTHFHLSMGAFSNTHLYRFMSFIYKNKDFMYSLSKRQNREWMESYASLSAENNNHLIKKAIRKANVINNNGHRSGDKYVAVNLKAGRTVEVRIFAGCDSFNLFMGWYEFLHALYEYTKSCPFKNNAWADFMGWLDFDQNRESRFPYLESLLSELNLIHERLDTNVISGSVALP